MFTPEHVSFDEFRDNLSSHLRGLSRSKRPKFILRNGKRAAVMLSTSAYEELTADAERQEAIAAIRRGLADAKHGRTTPFDEVLDRLDAKYAAMAPSKTRSKRASKG